MTYTIIESNNSKAIQRDNEDGSIIIIPIEPANSDYQRYLRWLENPNEVEHLTEIVPGNE